MNGETRQTNAPLGWITGLLHAVKEMGDEELWEPELDPSEKADSLIILGDVPEDLKRLFSLFRIEGTKATMARAAFEVGRTEKERAELEADYIEHQYKYRALKNLFWTCVQDHLGIWETGKTLSITVGWKFAISRDDSHNPGISELLDKILNG